MVYSRIILIILFVAFSLSPAFSGTLSDFRDSVSSQDEEQEKPGNNKYKTKNNPGKDKGKKKGWDKDDSDDDDSDGSVGEFFARAVVELLSIGAGNSVERMVGDNGDKREAGEALIPYVRLDLSRQDGNNDLEADDYRFEIGWGPVALHLAQLSYTEESADDQLDLLSTIFLLRTSLGAAVEIDFGIGALNIDKNQDDARGLITIPILIHPNDHVGFELRPSWTEHINDLDAALLLGGKHLSLKLGYRSVYSKDTAMYGPYLGMSLRY